MSLSQTQKKHLKALAHHLKPVVMVGQNGLSENVLQEVDIALAAHELIKVKISVGDRDARDQVIAEIQKQSESELIHRIGNVAIYFRRNSNKPKISLPST